MDFWEVAAVVNERFPQYAPILSKPGVWQVLEQAINEKWTPDRLQAALQNTEYYRTTTESERMFDALLATDPATAYRNVNESNFSVRLAADNLGVKLSDADMFGLSVNAAQYGWDTNRIMAEIGMKYRDPSHMSPFGLQPPGMIASKMTELRGIADSFGVDPGPDGLYHYAVNIASGIQSQDMFLADMRNRAIVLFPALAAHLGGGGTVADYAAPYFQMAAQETGANPASMNLRDPKWIDLFLTTDQNGQQAVRSQTEVLSTIRSDPRYGYDTGQPGRTQGAQFAQSLLKEFGAMG